MENKIKDIIFVIVLVVLIVFTFIIVNLSIRLEEENEKVNDLCSMNNELTNLTRKIMDIEYKERVMLHKFYPELPIPEKWSELSDINCEVFTK